ncbi:hypothetical protein [Salipiger thiooxidans]|uniref:hypothetical protein n=1 Tax=Salipiger thiooxidans TaxID=282683 RepID=UPI001CFBEB6C|nr:hypothetical protein [Salipiger thiooxidans]
MARYNKVFLGPVTENTPQVREAIASVAVTPGLLVVDSAGEFALAGAATVGKVWIAQDNYLAMQGVDADWDAGDTMIGMELLPQLLYAGRIANGVNIAAIGTALTPAANGLLAIASTSDKVIGYSEEVFNNTTGGTALIKFRPSQGYLTAAA